MNETANGAGNRIKKIVILGGGSSGWISASYLLKALNFNVDITLIESKKIGKIGVGEATIPTIKEELFDFLGIDESEWMPECKGAFKLGIRYENWKRSLQEGGDHYYHIFGEIPLCKGIPLSHVWMKKRLDGFTKTLDHSCYTAAPICDQLKSPKFLDGKRAVHYAYHFDAIVIADFLKKWSINRGLSFVNDDIVNVELDENGDIKSLTGSEGENYDADLFIDCSGFAALLIEKTLKEPLVSYSDCLLTDSAIALNIPSDSEREGIRPYTTATALSSGWMWQIPLFGRSGNGYVFSSAFISPEEAEKEIRNFFGKKSENIESRVVKFRSGRRRRSWVKNCVSFGLSSSFLEPLESTGLYFVYAALHQLVQYFPDKKINPALRDKFNERVSYMVEDVKDFIVMHFCTSPREDTPYWKANKYDLKIPDSLRSILDLQKAGIPIKKSYHGNDSLYSTFEAGFDRFWTNSNYQSVLAGVEYLPENIMPLLNHRKDVLDSAEKMFMELDQQTQRLLSELPSQYEYLQKQQKKWKMENSLELLAK